LKFWYSANPLLAYTTALFLVQVCVCGPYGRHAPSAGVGISHTMQFLER